MKHLLFLCLSLVLVSPFFSTFTLKHQRENDGVHGIGGYQFDPFRTLRRV